MDLFASVMIGLNTKFKMYKLAGGLCHTTNAVNLKLAC